jgi:multicomponent Na+:H+ antiporter subunit B
VKQIFTLVILLLLGRILVTLVPLAQPTPPAEVAVHYIEHGVQENRGANLVTSVVVTYRGFDTLGEVTVLFLSVAGVAFVLRRREGVLAHPQRHASEVLGTGAQLLFAPLVLLGIYIFVHGHLSPGGGFQGGAVIASAVMLMLAADRSWKLPHAPMLWIESLAGFGFVAIGLAGLWKSGSFLSNQGVLPLGTWNRLFSAGVIPVIYILVGLKVGTELSSLLDTLMDTGRLAEEVNHD